MAIYVGGTTDANKLDDYEEGSFTAQFSNAGSLNMTTTSGYYVKTGKLVHVQGEIFWNNDGTGTGSISITLPFTNNGGSSRGGFAIGLQSGIDVDSDHQFYMMPELNAGYAWLLMSKSDDPAGGHAHTKGNDIRNYASKAFSFGGTYVTG